MSDKIQPSEYTGSISDAKLWDRALSDEEIKQIEKNGSFVKGRFIFKGLSDPHFR